MNEQRKFEGLPQSEPMQLTVDTTQRLAKLPLGGISVRETSVETGGKKSKAKLLCPICGRQFHILHHLELHQRSHTGERPFKCKECDAKFACKNRLVLHTRKHTGERPYMCALCHQKFLQSAHLKVHMKTHSSEKPFKCTQCSKCFKFQQSLKIHILEHSEKWEFKCEVCDKLFTTAVKLKKHGLVHSEKKRYKCDKCGKQFRDAAYIAKHQSQFCGNDGYKNRWKNKPILPKAKGLKRRIAKEMENSDRIVLPRGRPKGSKNKKNRKRKQKIQLLSESDVEFEDFLRGGKNNVSSSEGPADKIYSGDKDPPFNLDDMIDNNEIDSSIGYIDLSYKSLQNSLNFKHNEVTIESDHCHSLRKYHDKPETMKVSSATIKSAAPMSMKENFVSASERHITTSSPVPICLPSVILTEADMRQSESSHACTSNVATNGASNCSMELNNTGQLKSTAMNGTEPRSSLLPALNRSATGSRLLGKEDVTSFGQSSLMTKQCPSEQLLQPFSEPKNQHQNTRPTHLHQNMGKGHQEQHRRGMIQQLNSLVEQQQVAESKFDPRQKEHQLPPLQVTHQQQMLSESQPLQNGAHSLNMSLGHSVLNKTTGGMSNAQCQHKSEHPVQIQPLIHMSDHIFDDQSVSSNLNQMNFANHFSLQSSHGHLDSNSLMNYSYPDNVKDFFNISVLSGSYDPNLSVDMHDNAQNLPLSLDLSVHNNLENIPQNPQNLSVPHNLSNLQHSLSAVTGGLNSGVAHNLALPQTYAIPQSSAGVTNNLSPPPSFNSHTHPDTAMPYDLSLIHHNPFSQSIGNETDGHASVQNYSRVNTNLMSNNLNNFGLSQNLCSLHSSSSLLQNLTSMPSNLNKPSNNLNSLPQNLSTMSDTLTPLALNLPLLQPESLPQNLTAQRLTSLPQNLSTFSPYLPQSIPQNLSIQNDFSSSYSSNSNQLMLSNTVHDLSTSQNLSNQTNINHISATQLPDELHQPQNLSQNHITQPENLSLPQNLSVQSAEKKNSCMAQPQDLCITSNAVVPNISHKVMSLQRSDCHVGSVNSNSFNSSSSMGQNLSNVDVTGRHMRPEGVRSLTGRVDSMPVNLNASMSSGATHPFSDHPNTVSNNHFNVQQNLLVPASFNHNIDMALSLSCPLTDDQSQKFGIPQNLSHPGKLKQYIQDLSCSSKLNSTPDNIPQNLSLDSQPQNLSESLPQNLSSSNKNHGAYSGSPVISQPYLAQARDLTSTQNWHI
ncbi:Zinc finger C2H2-type [Trinorchestia longiramus]|nr:Zinc finger C2H2-type [Trinorchestia longiramus]